MTLRDCCPALFLVSLLYVPVSGRAQSPTMPLPSRTVFRCINNGKVVYSDEPCRGAERLDITPTRGMNKIDGKERTGADVSKEKYRELFSDAIKSVTGLNHEQYDAMHRRASLSPEAKRECSNLDASMPALEAGPRTNAGSTSDLDERKYAARKRFRDLRC
jgi:hypothetical protein